MSASRLSSMPVRRFRDTGRSSGPCRDVRNHEMRQASPRLLSQQDVQPRDGLIAGSGPVHEVHELLLTRPFWEPCVLYELHARLPRSASPSRQRYHQEDPRRSACAGSIKTGLDLPLEFAARVIVPQLLDSLRRSRFDGTNPTPGPQTALQTEHGSTSSGHP